jgi:hypothetical protein
MRRSIIIAGAVLLFAALAPANDLNTYTATYEKKLAEIILSHGMMMSDVNRQYTEALAGLLAEVQKAGDLDKTKAVMSEIARFGNQKNMPSPPSELLGIQNLQSHYTRLNLPHAGKKAKSIITLTTQYDHALERLQRSLVSSGKLDDATGVQRERGRVQENAAYLAAKTFLYESDGAGRHSAANNIAISERGARHGNTKQSLNAKNLKGLVLWHSFDSRSTKSTDKSSQRNHGRVHNAEHTLKGKVGGALRFSGNDSYVRIPRSKSVDFKDAFTLMAWVKIEEVSAKLLHFIISRYEWTSGTGYGLLVDKSGGVACSFNGKNGHLASPSGIVESGKWVHLASVFDGKMLTCIVDGVAIASRERNGLINEKSDLFIGTPSNAVGHRDWTTLGLIDEVMIFNRALSIDEVSNIFSLQE